MLLVLLLQLVFQLLQVLRNESVVIQPAQKLQRWSVVPVLLLPQVLSAVLQVQRVQLEQLPVVAGSELNLLL